MRMLINARNGSVAVDGDAIVATGGRFDIVVDCPDADVRPGLINAHDHLHRNHYGRLGAGPYANAYHWAEDIQLRFARRIARVLDEGQRQNRYDRLIVMAPPEFLGLLREEMPAAVRATVTAEIGKDLVHEPPAALSAYLPPGTFAPHPITGN